MSEYRTKVKVLNSAGRSRDARKARRTSGEDDDDEEAEDPDP